MKVFSLFLMLGLGITPVVAQTPQPALPAARSAEQPMPPPPTLSAKSWVLVDALSGRVLAGHGANEKVFPASITKVMTSYVIAAERKSGKIKDTDQVYITENAWRSGGGGTDGSTSFLPVNSSIALKDLLMGMIVQSGNDASIALAEHVAGSEATFAELMNQYAKQLGMNGTHFVNASGLHHEDHYSTARDIALLGRALIRDFPEEYAHYAVKEYVLNGIPQQNRNTLLFRDPSVDGIKTGHHRQAGYCLAASARRGETRLISVLMGTNSEKIRADESQALLNYGFRFFETHKLYGKGQSVAEPTLWRGAAEKAKLGVAEDALITIPRGSYKKLAASINVPKPLYAPLRKGEKVGAIRVLLGTEEVLQAPLVAVEDFPEGGFFKRLSDTAWLWFDDGD
jgi:serine-type D-Ala-D-Ala carboxypeptidase (penicillin-binding protein 5/6)